MGIVIVWWLWMEVMGLAALPLAFRFFRRLPDRGYAFARPLGLLLTSYGLWLGASLGLLRNSSGGMLFSLAVVAIVSLIVYQRGRSAEEPSLWTWLRANGRVVLAVELLFAGAFAVWAVVRAYSPDLTTAGGEKFMEIMYLNSIGRSEYFPPHDAWLSGYAISYYYFGYVMMATLTRLSGQAAHLTFNVGEALLFALTCTGAFGLVYNLVKGVEGKGTGRGSRPIGYGLLGAVLVAVMGNLEGFLEMLYSARLLPEGFWRWLDIQEINQPFDPGAAVSLMPTRSGWWWWRASRVINDLDPTGKPMGIEPIDEFPGFSFLLGDMHPHVLALPFVLLALAVALRALLEGAADDGHGEGAEAGAAEAWWAPLRRLPVLVPLCLGALGFLNTWDLPTFLLVWAAAYGLGRWRQFGRLSWPLVRDVGVTGGATAVLAVLFYLPFYIGLQSQAGGVLPAVYVGTRFRQYFVMFGPFLVALAGLMAGVALHLRRQARVTGMVRRWVRWTAVVLSVLAGIMLLITAMVAILPQGRAMVDEIRSLPYVQELAPATAALGPLVGKLLLVKLRTWVMPLVVAALAALAALEVVLIQRVAGPRREKEEEDHDGALGHPALQFALVCAVAGLLLTLSVEFVYLVDVFRVRMNTIFKFYFQAWVLMAIASAFGAYWLSRMGAGKKIGRAFLVAFWLLVAMGMVYPVLGNLTRAGSFQGQATLDGSAYLAASQPDDYAAIAWLNDNVAGAPVILEAPGSGGSSYVYEGRVSALTGLPTLVGWAGHEGQWRGNYDVQNARDPDIEAIYNTLDAQAALTLLDKYDISYVYVGPLERSKYEARGLAKFEGWDVAYQNDGVTIYRVRK